MIFTPHCPYPHTIYSDIDDLHHVATSLRVQVKSALHFKNPLYLSVTAEKIRNVNFSSNNIIHEASVSSKMKQYKYIYITSRKQTTGYVLMQYIT